MDVKYSRLFALYPKTPGLFQETIERIGKDKFNYDILRGFLAHTNSNVLEGTRRILLTHHSGLLTNKMLCDFCDFSGDSEVQKKASEVLEKRVVDDYKLRFEADSVVALFA